MKRDTIVYEVDDKVDEAVEDLNAGASYEEIQDEVEDLPLEEFCQQLDFLVRSDDPKAKALYDTFRQGWKKEFRHIKVHQAFVNIRELHPTQNVIYAHKSLDLILNGKWKMPGVRFAVDRLLGEEKPQVEMGDPIVICNVGGVDYLIDGHHRWSKAYAFNPSCTMRAYIIEGGFSDEDEVLKFAQGTLTLLRNKSPINNAQPTNDINLYDISPKELSNLVHLSLNREVLEHIRNLPVTEGIVNDPSTLVSYLWSNVRILRQYAPKGAHDREFMPQFPDGDTNPANAVAKIAENTRITLTIGQLRRLVRESDEVKLQMVALKKAYDQVKKGESEAKAGSWRITQSEDDVYQVYFKDAVILEIDYAAHTYSCLMKTVILSRDMVDAILDTLDCKDFKLEGDRLPKFLFENAQDWVYIDGIEITPTNRFGLNKRWKTWFFNTPQEALRFAKNMQDKHDGSSVDVIRHSFDRYKMHTKDPDESWEEAIETIKEFVGAKTVNVDLGDLGSIEVPADVDIDRLQNKVMDFIRGYLETAEAAE